MICQKIEDIKLFFCQINRFPPHLHQSAQRIYRQIFVVETWQKSAYMKTGNSSFPPQDSVDDRPNLIRTDRFIDIGIRAQIKYGYTL